MYMYFSHEDIMMAYKVLKYAFYDAKSRYYKK